MTGNIQVTKRGMVFLIGVIFCCLAVYIFIRRVSVFEFSASDLHQDYLAAQHLLRNESIYSEPIFQNNHPPITAILMIPLSYLTYSTAGTIWSIISLILFIFSGWLVYKELDVHLDISYLLVLIGFGICWYPFQANIALGQWSIIIGALIAIGWVCLRKDWDYLSGIMFGLASLVKMFPGLIIIYLLFTKRWKASLAMVLTIIIGMAITARIVGISDFTYYFTTIISRDSAEFSTYPQNFSILGILGKFFQDGNWVSPILISPFPIEWLAYGLDIIVVILLISSLVRFSGDKANHDILFSLTLIATFFISPISWDHTLTILTIPVFLLLIKYTDGRRRSNIEFFLVMTAIFLLSLPDIQIIRSLMAVYFPYRIPWYFGLVLLFYDVGLVILWLLIKPSARSPENQKSPASKSFTKADILPEQQAN